MLIDYIWFRNSKRFNLRKIYRTFFFIFKPKVVYLRTFLSFLPFFKFLQQRFVYFGHKHVETGPNYSYELATFLNSQSEISYLHPYIQRAQYYACNGKPVLAYQCRHSTGYNAGIALRQCRKTSSGMVALA